MRAATTIPSQALEGWLPPATQLAAHESVAHFLLQFQSTHTRRNYQIDLQGFFEFWQARNVELLGSFQNTQEKHILLWLETFKHNPTRARKLASLSSFFKFCVTRRLMDSNPCSLLRRPPSSNRKTAVALTENEVETLMTFLQEKAFSATYDGAHAQRKRATALLRFSVLHTLFCVGMRVDELCEMRICDIEFSASPTRITFVTKGGDEHTTVVSESCSEVLKYYLQEQRKNTKPTDFVFTRVQSAAKPVKLSQTSVFQMIREAALEAGINKNLSPHSARATVATVLHRQGVPLGFIQNLLNHKQITTTAKYVKKANERSESAALKSPAARWIGSEQSD